MPPLGDACVPLPIDREPNPSSVPAKIDTADTHGGGPERTPSRRINHSLRAGESTAARLRSLWEIVFIATVFASSILLASGTAHAEPASSTARPAAMRSADRFADFVAEASRRFDVPAHWIRAVMHAESAANARALSPKGAMGLMQIMPATYATLRARYALGANPLRSTRQHHWPAPRIFARCLIATARRDSSRPTMRDRVDTRSICAPVDRCPSRLSNTSQCWRRSSAADSSTIGLVVVADAGAWLRALLFPVQAESKPADDRPSFAVQPERRPTAPRNCRSVGPRAAVGRSVRAPHRGASSRNDSNRASSQLVGDHRMFGGKASGARGTRAMDGKVKAPTSGRAHVVGWVEYFWRCRATGPAGALRQNTQRIQCPERRRSFCEPRVLRHDQPRRRPPCPAGPHPARRPRRQASQELRRRGHASREEGRPYRRELRPRQGRRAAVRASAGAGAPRSPYRCVRPRDGW